MDWKLFRELRLLLTQLPDNRFWAVWILLSIGVCGLVAKQFL